MTYKLSRPTIRNHVRRTALLKDLDRAQKDTPITWVMGLPGSGKTSIVARWVQESGRDCIWYRLDESDADMAGLLHAVAQAASPRLSLPVWSPENQMDLELFAQQFFLELAHAPLTLVLDDCHRVPDAAPLLAAMAQVQRVCGEHLRCILISRRAAPAALATGRAGGWLAVLDNLRMTHDEALEVAGVVRGHALDDAQTRAVLGADGWLAHVLALARSPQAQALATEQQAPGEVSDFLAEELLASLPQDLRAPLRRLAELPEIPQPRPPSTFLAPEISRLLAGMAAQRYFVDATAQGHWRLHDLLRDGLRMRNLAQDDELTLQRVRRELAQWVEALMPEAALDLRVQARDVEGCLSLLALHGESWLASGQHRMLFDALSTLPAKNGHDTAAQAALELWRAQALLPLEPEAARPLFASARELAVQAGDVHRAYTAWCGEVASYVVQWGAVQGLAELVDELEALHTRVGKPPGELAFRTSADALTALMYGRAEDPRITRYAEDTARAVAHATHAEARITAAAQLLIYKLWWAGDFPGGRALYDAFDAEVRQSASLPPLPRLVWWSCASIVDWQCGEPQACYDKVEQGLALASTSGVHVRDFFLLTQGIFCALSQEDWPTAERYLGQLALTERSHKRLDVMVHHFFRSWYSLCRGDPRTALAHAQTAWPMAEAMGSTFHKVIVLSALSPAAVHCGDMELAQNAYRQQLALAKAARNPTFSFIAFCAGAEIALAVKDEEMLAKQVERMLYVKHLGGFHSGCGWRTPVMRELLAFALRRGIWPEVARQWIREKRVTPPADIPSGWPMPVRIAALDGLQVSVEPQRGQEAAAAVKAGGKGAQKLRELVAALVVEQAGASNEDLCEWLWPDAEGDKAAASLKVAVHRLRQWLGSESVRVRDGVVSLNPDRVDCDLWRAAPDAIVGSARRVLHGVEIAPVLALRKRLQA
jgi:LuxR family maltose regulon positive regulatory protein